jgi:hypothetical protein
MSKRNGKGWYPIPVGIGEPILYPSVTTILRNLAKYHLIDWAGKVDVECFKRGILDMVSHGSGDLDINERIDALAEIASVYHKEVSQDAMDYGSGIHNSMDVYHKTGAYPLGPTLRQPFEACLEEEQASGIKVIESEFMVYSNLHKYAGTLDVHCLKGMGENDGIVVTAEGIQDYKTYSGKKPTVYPEHLLQVAAYAHALEEMTGKFLDFADIIYLNRNTGLPTRKTFNRLQLINPFDRFKCLCEYFHLSHKKS